MLAALSTTADEKLNGFALRLVLSDHVGIPHESQPDLLSEAEQVFAPKPPKAAKSKATVKAPDKKKPSVVKASSKTVTAKRS